MCSFVKVHMAAVLALLLSVPALALDCETSWKKLSNGLDYRTITCLGETDATDLHVVRIDPEDWKFNTALSEITTARAIAGSKDAAFVINTNFFDKNRRALGLIVRSGEEVRGAADSTWQSIFLIDEKNRARIILPKSWSEYRDRT